MEKGLCGYGISTFCVNCSETKCKYYYDYETDSFPNKKEKENDE